MNSLNLSEYIDFDLKPIKIKVLNCVFRLDRETILKALQSESIIVEGIEYEVPEEQLIDLLKNKIYGSIRIKLTEKSTK